MRSTLDPEERRVCDLVDRDALIAAVRRLVRVESWNGAERSAQEAVAELADDAGLDVDAWEIDLPSVQQHPAASWEIDRADALGVEAGLGAAEGGRTLILNGHVDVVPPGERALWRHPPFGGVVEKGRVYGRGALDLKGPLMAGLFALRAVRAAGIELTGRVRLQSVIGEEDGGIGTLAAILRGGGADGAIVLEPTELAVAPAQAGCLNFRVRVRGKAAHGAVRDEGVSALEKLFPVYEALVALETRRNATAREAYPLFARYRTPFPISVGTVSGGEWASSVPAEVAIEGRLGVRPDEMPEDARRALEDAVATTARADPWLAEHPPAVEWWGGRFLPVSTPVDHEVTTTVAGAAAATLGGDPVVEGVPYGADAGLLAHVAGTPTVLFGAGDIRDAHRPDESVAIDDLVAMSRTLAVTVMRFCR